MYNRQVYQNNNRGVFIPLVIGGIIGYGLGNNNRPNCCPIYCPMPFYNTYPIYQQQFFRR